MKPWQLIIVCGYFIHIKTFYYWKGYFLLCLGITLAYMFQELLTSSVSAVIGTV